MRSSFYKYPLVWRRYLGWWISILSLRNMWYSTDGISRIWCGPTTVSSRLAMDVNKIFPFSFIIRLLAGFSGKVYYHGGKRTKLSVSSVELFKIWWFQLGEDAFVNCKQALQDQAILVRRNVDQRLRVYIVASNIFWSGIVTQISSCDLVKPHPYHGHTSWISIRSLYWFSTWLSYVRKRKLCDYGNYRVDALDSCSFWRVWSLYWLPESLHSFWYFSHCSRHMS